MIKLLLGSLVCQRVTSADGLLLTRDKNMKTIMYEHVKQQTEFAKQIAIENLLFVDASIQSLKSHQLVQDAWKTSQDTIMPYYTSFNVLLTEATKEWALIVRYISALEMKVWSEMEKAVIEGVEYCRSHWNGSSDTSQLHDDVTPPGYAVIPPKTVLAAYFFNLDVTEQVKKLMENGTFRLPDNADVISIFSNPLKGVYKPIVVVWVSETGCVQSRAFMQDLVNQQRGFILWN